MKKKNNGLVIILMGIIIIILAVLCVLFATGTIILKSSGTNISNNDSSKTLTETYAKFLNEKEYIEDFDKVKDGTSKYAYYDLDNNGIDELIIYTNNKSDFGETLFYTVVNDKVKLIDRKYHYGNLTFNKESKSIVFSTTRPSNKYGWAYEFYNLNNNLLVLNKVVEAEIKNGATKYYVTENNKTEISKSNYNSYFDNNISFDYTDIK